MKAAVGFLHAGNLSRAVTEAALARKGRERDVVHLVDATLVDGGAQEFPITDARYAMILACAGELATGAERIVLSCSVYNGVAPMLQEDLHVPVERSDAAAIRAVLNTEGPVGVLVSYPPTVPVVVDYLSEALAGAEQQREIRTSLAEDAAPFITAAAEYKAALVAALEPLRDCGVVLLAQYTMNAHVADLRRAWGAKPLISALEATVDELFA